MNNAICSNMMDLEMIILSEISQTEKDNIIWHHLHVESKKWYKWAYVQNRNRLTDIEHKFMVPKGDSGGGGNKLGVWDKHIHTTIYKIDKQWGSTV